MRAKVLISATFGMMKGNTEDHKDLLIEPHNHRAYWPYKLKSKLKMVFKVSSMDISFLLLRKRMISFGDSGSHLLQ